MIRTLASHYKRVLMERHQHQHCETWNVPKFVKIKHQGIIERLLLHAEQIKL